MIILIRLYPITILDIVDIKYKNGNVGRYFKIKIDRNRVPYIYKILIPNRYIDIDKDDPYKICEKLINDKSYNIRNNNNCLPLEKDTHYTKEKDIYVIIHNMSNVQEFY